MSTSDQAHTLDPASVPTEHAPHEPTPAAPAPAAPAPAAPAPAAPAPTAPAPTAPAPTGAAATDPADEAKPVTPVPQTTRKGRRAQRGTRFVFIDTEATGLDHERHELTEVAWIVRFEDGRQVERQYFPQHTIDGADADALTLTHYEERIAPRERTPASEWLRVFLEDADGAILVGAVPDFDARHLDRMCRKLKVKPTWDHHLLDVETLALPLIAPGPEAPRSLAKTCAALGLSHDEDQAHGALYDARQAMRVFDRVWEMLAQLRAAKDPLPPPVPRNGPSGAPTPAADPQPDPHAPGTGNPTTTMTTPPQQ